MAGSEDAFQQGRLHDLVAVDAFFSPVPMS